jgi:Ca2+/Na+ antiporter
MKKNKWIATAFLFYFSAMAWTVFILYLTVTYSWYWCFIYCLFYPVAMYSNKRKKANKAKKEAAIYRPTLRPA